MGCIVDIALDFGLETWIVNSNANVGVLILSTKYCRPWTTHC